ncbi:hypothetical protein SLNWT_1747 [Streptomyces albus]|uniref:Uncharacterized protein n=1 Tax=Streptomyces albus (strain ATCC 21838 / DSM 41398 / FERM P-419 / JCM 4703 / NBRC 107858) TaxID=1081613 RepID=A0A0B5EIN5_STRA4|nr:hypothetical protein SLNWT_1747 [Streptomyces albus]
MRRPLRRAPSPDGSAVLKDRRPDRRPGLPLRSAPGVRHPGPPPGPPPWTVTPDRLTPVPDDADTPERYGAQD